MRPERWRLRTGAAGRRALVMVSEAELFEPSPAGRRCGLRAATARPTRTGSAQWPARRSSCSTRPRRPVRPAGLTARGRVLVVLPVGATAGLGAGRRGRRRARRLAAGGESWLVDRADRGGGRARRAGRYSPSSAAAAAPAPRCSPPRWRSPRCATGSGRCWSTAIRWAVGSIWCSARRTSGAALARHRGRRRPGARRGVARRAACARDRSAAAAGELALLSCDRIGDRPGPAAVEAVSRPAGGPARPWSAISPATPPTPPSPH